MEGLSARMEEWLRLFGDDRRVQALVIAVAAVLLAKVVDWVICRVLRRLLARTKSTLDDRVLDLLHRPLFVTVVLIGLGLATQRLDLGSGAGWLTLAVLKTIAVLVWAVFAFRLCSLLITALGERAGDSNLVQARTVPLFDNLTRVLLAGAVVYFIFLTWGIDLTAWLASAGIIGIALGFAAKDTLANLFSGMFILADAPYKIGDYIVLDTGERGQVTQVGLRSTRVLTRDDIEVTIPNAVIANAKIINETGGPHTKRRLRVAVGVAYGSDVDRVRQLLLDVAAAESAVVEEPEARVRFRSFGESGLDFELLCWVDEPVLSGSALDRLNTAIYKRFAAEEIEIPYPKRDVYVRQLPAGG